jgi:glycosyltransferase involved in cell wall biosynthesis
MALGPFLAEVAARSGAKSSPFLYYGVDTELYAPVSEGEKRSLRERLGLPADKFLVFLPSRISHEKDPETVIKAVSIARKCGLDAALINLSGDYKMFLALAAGVGIPDFREWVLAGPPAHPMRDLPDYYRSADCVALASLEEGLGMSPLESLACGTPAVCTAVGGMAHTLPGYARLVPRQDAAGMANEILWVARNQHEAQSQALLGRAYVQKEWGRERAFEQISQIFKEVSRRNRPSHAE